MVKLKNVNYENITEGVKFKARANVNFGLPVNKFEDIRKYNASYLEKLKEINGDNIKLPLSMGYKPIRRGDILCFGDKAVIDTDTGQVKVYPIEVYDEMSKLTVELPCLMAGVVDSNLTKINALASPAMRKALEAHKGDTARFRVKPYLEKYDGTQPDIDEE